MFRTVVVLTQRRSSVFRRMTLLCIEFALCHALGRSHSPLLRLGLSRPLMVFVASDWRLLDCILNLLRGVLEAVLRDLREVVFELFRRDFVASLGFAVPRTEFS